MVISLVRRAFLAVILPVAMVILLAVSAYCGCATCGGSDAVPGVDVNMTNGTTSVMPIVDFNMGPAAPARSDAHNMPGAGNVRNLGTPANPLIKWGTSRITTDSGSVLIDGVVAPNWTWNSATNSLITADGRIYAFDDSSGLLTRMSGSDGLRVSTLAYDSQGHVTQASDSYGNTWTYDVDTSVPGPTGVTDPDGTKRAEISYQPYETNGFGQYKTVKIMYLGPNNQWVEQQSTNYSYDNLSRITSVVTSVPDYSEVTSTTNVTYYPTDQAGLTQPVQRVENSKLKYDMTYSYSTESIATSGGVNTYGVVTQRRRAIYSPAGTDTDSSDQVTKYYYYRDDNGKNTYIFRTVKQIYNGSSWADYATTEYRVYLNASDTRFTNAPTYDDNLKGRVWKTIDDKGNATSYTYNMANALADTITLPTGDHVQYWYNNSNAGPYVVKVRDARGTYTQYVRDINHPSLVTEMQVSDNGTNWTTVKQVSYYSTPAQKEGLVYQVTVPDIDGSVDMVTTYDYSEIIDLTTYYRHSPTKETYSWWNGTTYEDKSSTSSYYADGRLRWSKDALNRQTDYTYDSQLRLTLTVYKWENDIVDGTPEVYSENHYDCCNLIWSRDENGNKTYYSYDDMNRVTKTWTDIPGQSEITPLVEYEYDVFGNQSAVITRSDSGSARVTSYAYDKANRVTRITYPYDTVEGDLLSSEYFQYDTAGRLSAKLVGLVDAQGAITRGQVTAYSYDAWDRLEKVKYNYLGGDPNPHWPLSAPVDISTADVAYAYELPVGDARVGSTLRTSMTDSSGESEYTYDYRGRLKTYKPPIGLDSGYYVEYDYNNVGQKTQVKITNGTATAYSVTYDYFANGRLKNVKYNGDTIAGYSYDEVGNRTRQINGNGTYTDYDYADDDPRYMMDSITHYKMAGATPNPASDPKLADPIAYTRDNSGNPLTMTDSIGTWDYGYDSNNRLTTAVPPNPIPEQPAGGSYSYDWVGNRLNAPADPNPMVYNAADQLTTWPGMHTYTYYGDGSLKEEKNAAGTSVLKSYTYTPGGLLSTAEFNGKTLTNTWDADKNRVGFSVNSVYHTFVYDTSAGIPAVIKEDSVYYIREPNGSLIARVSGSNTSYYHFDQLGSTRLLSNNTGTVTDEYTYDAYGSLLSHNRREGSVDQPYQYVGRLGYYTHYQEPEFRLLQLGVRFYDAEVGGFTQRDPIEFDDNDYGYASALPVVLSDPLGLAPNVDCNDLVQKIWEVISKLLRHHKAMMDDFDQLYLKEKGCIPYKGSEKGTWTGHQKEYDGFRNRLKNLLEKFYNEGCKGGKKIWQEHQRREAPAMPEYERVKHCDCPIQDVTWKLIPILVPIKVPFPVKLPIKLPIIRPVPVPVPG